MSKEFTVEQLQDLIKCVADSKIGEFLYEDDEVKLRIRGQGTALAAAPSAIPAPMDSGAAAPAVPAPEASVAAAPAEAAGAVIASPIVGTFYAAAGPDKEPFVKVGQQVKEGETVFIIESMKVMNEVPADKSGTVAEILVENGEGVEYGQPILRLE